MLELNINSRNSFNYDKSEMTDMYFGMGDSFESYLTKKEIILKNNSLNGKIITYRVF